MYVIPNVDVNHLVSTSLFVTCWDISQNKNACSKLGMGQHVTLQWGLHLKCAFVVEKRASR